MPLPPLPSCARASRARDLEGGSSRAPPPPRRPSLERQEVIVETATAGTARTTRSTAPPPPASVGPAGSRACALQRHTRARARSARGPTESARRAGFCRSRRWSRGRRRRPVGVGTGRRRVATLCRALRAGAGGCDAGGRRRRILDGQRMRARVRSAARPGARRRAPRGGAGAAMVEVGETRLTRAHRRSGGVFRARERPLERGPPWTSKASGETIDPATSWPSFFGVPRHLVPAFMSGGSQAAPNDDVPLDVTRETARRALRALSRAADVAAARHLVAVASGSAIAAPPPAVAPRRRRPAPRKPPPRRREGDLARRRALAASSRSTPRAAGGGLAPRRGCHVLQPLAPRVQRRPPGRVPRAEEQSSPEPAPRSRKPPSRCSASPSPLVDQRRCLASSATQGDERRASPPVVQAGSVRPQRPFAHLRQPRDCPSGVPSTSGARAQSRTRTVVPVLSPRGRASTCPSGPERVNEREGDRTAFRHPTALLPGRSRRL